jgi:pimeloyl-ACP methyl ester carboxylesterase
MSTWILLRGLTREARHWGDFPATLRKVIPDAEVVAVDLPGNGRLHSMASPVRVEEMAEYCRAELGARGIPPPYHLLALSLGAMVAVAWATDHPQEIRSCVLINTSLRPFSPFYHRLRPENYAALCQRAFLGGERAWEELILRLTSSHLDRHREALDAWLSYRRECPVSSRNALRQLLAASRYRAPEGRLSVPMLILASAADALVDPRCSRQLALHWRVRIAEHPTAGHDIPLDDGAWVAEQVRTWL